MNKNIVDIAFEEVDIECDGPHDNVLPRCKHCDWDSSQTPKHAGQFFQSGPLKGVWVCSRICENKLIEAIELNQLRNANASMLAALISVDKQIEALIGEENWYSSNQAANLCREVRAAIAKATGAGKGVHRAGPTVAIQ